MEEIEPLLTVGLIADPQYADIDDGYNFRKTRKRFYRSGLKLTENAIKTWNDENEAKSTGKNRPSLVVCLGDIIDGYNARDKQRPDMPKIAMERVLTTFSQFKPHNPEMLLSNIEKYNKINKWHNDGENDSSANSNLSQLSKTDWIATYPYFHNCAGNHEFYNFSRQKYLNYFYSPNNDCTQFYYCFQPLSNYLFIILDGFLISTLGYDDFNYNHENKREAQRILDRENPQEEQNNPPNTNDDKQRFAAYNGGFGKKQLIWLNNILNKCENLENKINVLIFTHIPVHCEKGNENILAWDYKEIRKLINKYSCVKMVFAGHDHPGFVVKDNKGVWYNTLAGAIEAKPGNDCFGTLYLYNNYCQIKGYGDINDQTFPFRPHKPNVNTSNMSLSNFIAGVSLTVSLAIIGRYIYSRL